MSNKPNVSWQNVNVDALPDNLKQAFEGIRAARKAFEAAFVAVSRERGKLPEGKTLAFAYKRGLGVAVVDAASRNESNNKTFSL